MARAEGEVYKIEGQTENKILDTTQLKTKKFTNRQ